MQKFLVINRLKLLVAEFFYFGRFPFMPGTMGSLASLIIWIPSVYFSWSLWLKIFLLVSLFFLGVWASEYAIRHYKKADPKQVVIDEVVGQGLVFLIVSPILWQVSAAFILFRFFDIWKPWPIKSIEHRFKNKWGLMLDDVIAALFAMLVLYGLKFWWLHI